jgi:hypothetical protein
LLKVQEKGALLSIEVGIDAVGWQFEATWFLLEDGAAGADESGPSFSQVSVTLLGFGCESLQVGCAPVSGKLAGEGLGGERVGQAGSD